jgi:phosphatidylserine decarboxylase
MISRYGLREVVLITATAGVGGIAAAVAAAQVSAWYLAPAVPLLAAWLAGLAFFRDPSRTMPDAPGILVSPADGTVTEITRLDRGAGFEGPALRIGIFLSIFDVHVNRSPCAGRVLSTAYERGEFLDARHPESGHRNEANTIVIEPDEATLGPVVVRQIAGLIARRVVCRLKPGDRVQRGERIGMLKFGSRTELIVRSGVGLVAAVKLGEHVRGGTTALMDLASAARGCDFVERQMRRGGSPEGRAR